MRVTSTRIALAVIAIAWTLAGQQNTPPVFLNHIGIILPAPVYQQFLHSQFLRDELSGYEEKTVAAQSAAGSWMYTGVFVRGRQTYLECFESGKVQFPGDPSPRLAGQIAFHMSVDHRSQLPIIRDRVASEFAIPIGIDTVRNAKQMPSYDTVIRVGGLQSVFNGGAFSVRALTSYPDGLTREKQRAASYLPDRLLSDITGITVTVNEGERQGLLQSFRAFGYTVTKEGDKQIVTGPEITFTLLPEKPAEPRILALDVSLNRKKSGEQTYDFAKGSELQFDGSSAKWTFRFPRN